MVEVNLLAWIGIGFTLAAAVGPIWLLVAQRTLADGWRYGIASGVGVAAADGLFGLLGALGLQAVALAMQEMGPGLRMAGGAVMLVIGIRIALSAGAVEMENGEGKTSESLSGLLGAGASIFLLTLANPLTIISFAAVYTGVGEQGLGLGSRSAWLFAGSIFTGSMLWWAALVGGISMGRKRINPRLVAWINRAAGAAIALLGVGMLLRGMG